MGAITGFTEGEARAYFADTATKTSTSVVTETITGKALPASEVVISDGG